MFPVGGHFSSARPMRTGGLGCGIISRACCLYAVMSDRLAVHSDAYAGYEFTRNNPYTLFREGAAGPTGMHRLQPAAKVGSKAWASHSSCAGAGSSPEMPPRTHGAKRAGGSDMAGRGLWQQPLGI